MHVKPLRYNQNSPWKLTGYFSAYKKEITEQAGKRLEYLVFLRVVAAGQLMCCVPSPSSTVDICPTLLYAIITEHVLGYTELKTLSWAPGKY